MKKHIKNFSGVKVPIYRNLNLIASPFVPAITRLDTAEFLASVAPVKNIDTWTAWYFWHDALENLIWHLI